MNRKIFAIVLMILTAAALMTACMSGTAAQPAPSVSPSFMPDNSNTGMSAANAGSTNTGTVNAGRTTENSNGALGMFDWANNAASIETNISRISEIAESRVVDADKTALVGEKFAPEYKGELTERIREMVAAEVKKADPAIETVAVTANEEDVSKVYDLSEKARTGNPVEAIADKVNEIVRNATTLR
ncbi:MAG: YhcN/YlaJ family sporulation lipoprotein [Clostridia bacterium]|nr:YhcN/YlaJ family sporulation lipoprotein [Clostridia bacterium]